MAGTYVYRSGAREPGSITGTYTGINSHDLEVKLDQFNLDGTPAARPVQQPAATLLKVRYATAALRRTHPTRGRCNSGPGGCWSPHR
jgi:hypothetical protein